MGMALSRCSTLLSLPLAAQDKILAQLTPEDRALLAYQWDFWARDDQRVPLGDWFTWILLSGRGAGKTRTGGEFIRSEVKRGAGIVGLIAPTASDARDVMVEGPSGLLSVCGPRDVDYKNNFMGRPQYEPSKRRVTWANGARAMLFSAEEPDRLRGPQHQVLWCDELAAWKYLRDTWDMAQFGLRLMFPDGSSPRQCVTTTPRPLAVVREIVADLTTVVTRASTNANRAFLSPRFIQRIEQKYAGTRLGRQELDGEILDDVMGALWTADMFDTRRAKDGDVGHLTRIVVAVDPSGSITGKGDEQGIVVAGSRDERHPTLGDVPHAVVLEDATMNGKPAAWGRRVVQAYKQHNADLVVAEANYGGEMVRHTIHSIDPNVPVKMVTATRGKVIRAQPISSFYEQGRVRHCGIFKLLEDQLCGFTDSGYTGEKSPDRADACIWALTELLSVPVPAAPLFGVSGRINNR